LIGEITAERRVVLDREVNLLDRALDVSGDGTYITGDIVHCDISTRLVPSQFYDYVPITIDKDPITIDGQVLTLRTTKTAERPGVLLNGRYRITARTIRVSGDGAETVDLELAALGRFL
jgi:hypothetical protein